MRRSFPLAALLIAGLAGSAPSAQAQSVTCLVPGDFRNDFTFTPAVVNRSLQRKARTVLTRTFPATPLDNPSIFGVAAVEFGGQNILLEANAIRTVGVPGDRQIEAWARGKLYLDFEVCGGTADATTTVAVSFKVKRVGRISTFLPGSTSSFGVSARFRDMVDGRDVDFRVIEDTSVGNLLGAFKTIAKVPIPIPELEQSSIAKIETFVLQLRKGRHYRFELSASAKSTTGLMIGFNPVLRHFATADFRNPFIELGLGGTAGIELVDFSMDVALDPADVQQELTTLRTLVTSLQNALASLGERVEGIGPNVEVLVSDLHEKIAEQGETHAQEIETLRLDVEERVADVRHDLETHTDEFSDHTHDYLTGQGRGHNNTGASTSTPIKKVP